MGIHVAAGARVTTSITNYYSAGSVNSTGSIASATTFAKTTASGALTANTLATVLTVTGAGSCSYLAARAADGTTRTIRLQVIVDGATVFDATTSAAATAGVGLIAAGSFNASSGAQPNEPIVWNSSLVVKVASSLSETDKINTDYLVYGE